MSLSFGTQKSAETVTLACHGQIIAGNEGSALREKVQQLMKDSPNVILDLRNVSYIDGSGLGVPGCVARLRIRRGWNASAPSAPFG